MAVKSKQKKCLVAVRITPDLFRWVKEKSEEDDLSMGAVVRRELLRAKKQERGATA